MSLVCSSRDPRLTKSLSGSSDGGLKLWNLQNGELIRDLSSSNSSKTKKVQAVAADWTKMRAVSGSYSGCLNLWDLSSGTDIVAAEGHEEEVNAIEADWADMRAVSGSSDGYAKLWNIDEQLTCIHTLQAGATVFTLAVNWSRNRAFGGLRTGIVRIWDLLYGTCLKDISVGAAAADAANTAVSTISMDPVGNRAVSGLEDGHLAYWHYPSLEDVDADAKAPATIPATKVLLAHYSAVRTIVTNWVPSGSRSLIGSDDGSLSLWRLDSQECLARFARHIGMVWALSVDWGRERAVSGAFDGCIKIWELNTGECIRTLQGHSRPVRSIAIG
jgi:WD40 repeat protein